jgi:hypothetical protein
MDNFCRYCQRPDLPQPKATCECAAVAHASCLLRHRSRALEAFLCLGGWRNREAFERCVLCHSEYRLAPSEARSGAACPRRLPFGWMLLLGVWLCDLLAILTLAYGLALAIAIPLRAAVVGAILDSADADRSGTLELEEAIWLAVTTGDEDGAALLPRVIRALPPLGRDELSAQGLRLVYLSLWEPGTLVRDSRALRVLAECATPAAGHLERLHLCAARRAVAWAPGTAAWTAAGLAIVALLLWLSGWYCARGRRLLTRWLAVTLCDARAMELTGGRHSREFWRRVFELGRIEPRTHVALSACALSACAQWVVAAAAWVPMGCVLHEPLLSAPLSWPRLTSCRFLLSPLLPSAHADGGGRAHALLACAALAAVDLLALSTATTRHRDRAHNG